MEKDKVVPLEDRLPQLKKERKQKANRRFIFYATVFFLLILIVVYFQSPLSRVRHISVTGEQIAGTESVVRASGISQKTHIWDIRTDEAEKKIEKLPTVKSAEVRTNFPNQVNIQIKEFNRKAYLFKGGRYYPILQNGAILSEMPEDKLPVDAPVLVGFENPEMLKKVAEGLSGLPQQVIHSISDIHYINSQAGEDDLVLYMNDGNRIVASTRTFAKNIRLYPGIAANLPEGTHGTIHLSVGSYFVPYDETKEKNR